MHVDIGIMLFSCVCTSKLDAFSNYAFLSLTTSNERWKATKHSSTDKTKTLLAYT